MNMILWTLWTTEDTGFKNGDSLWKSPCRILVSSFEFEIYLRFKSFNSCARSESSSESTLSGCVGDANFSGRLMLMVDLKGAELFLFFLVCAFYITIRELCFICSRPSGLH